MEKKTVDWAVKFLHLEILMNGNVVVTNSPVETWNNLILNHPKTLNR